MTAFEYMYWNGITDETCAPYLALSLSEGRKCEATSKCKECPPGGAKCIVPAKFNTYAVSAYGLLPSKDVDAMQKEILANGPLSCGINAIPIKDYKKSDGIITSSDQGEMDHLISVAGWGVEDGVEFWYVRNSWGEYWGDNGWAKVEKGKNTLRIEEYCAWAIPKNTWDNSDEEKIRTKKTDKIHLK